MLHQGGSHMPEGNELAWYVVHTYSGYENKVMDSLQKTVDNRGLQDTIRELRVPVEEVVEIKNGRRHVVQHKIYPGYVLVRMVMNDESWYVVRNTRGVTGFVGPGSKPVPLTEEEVQSMLADTQRRVSGVEVGDTVTILTGPFENFSGVVQEIDAAQKRVRVSVMFIGRETFVELDLDQVNKEEE